MKKEEFRANTHQVVDWMADYLEEKENYPVTSDVAPIAIFFDDIHASVPEMNRWG